MQTVLIASLGDGCSGQVILDTSIGGLSCRFMIKGIGSFYFGMILDCNIVRQSVEKTQKLTVSNPPSDAVEK